MFKRLRPAVVLFPVLVFTVLVVAGVVDGNRFINTLNSVFSTLMVNASWLVSLGVLAFVVFMLFILFHPVGNIVLGGKDAKPEHSLWSWFAISLCAGIGTGIVFWGPVEPLLFTCSPQTSTGIAKNSIDALIWAFDKSYLHWSFAPYACYCVFGVVLAYAIYNLKSSFSVSSGFAPLIGKASDNTKLKGIVDTLTVFALTGGVAGSLGYGLLQISSGLNTVFGIPQEPLVCIIICGVIVVAFSISSISGIDRGIKWLSDKNAWMFLALMILAFVFGPSQWICNLFTQTFGHFVSTFVSNITAVMPFSDSGVVLGNAWFNDSEMWSQWWDQYYFVDYLSFGAIVGLFSIRLAKGRTLRQFVIMNWLVPALFGIIWFAVFGGLSLDIQFNPEAYRGVIDLQSCASLYDYMIKFGNEAMMLKVVEALPFSWAIKPLVLLLIGVSFVTLADSMTSTISQISLKSTDGDKEAPVFVKLMWAVLIGAASLVFTLTGSIDGIKIVKTIAGFPILLVGIAMMICFLVAMHKDGSKLFEDIRAFSLNKFKDEGACIDG